MNVCRLMPPDYIENHENSYENNGKFLKPQLVIDNNDGALRENYRLFTWKNPVKCNECNEYIDDYEYYYYEKRNVDKYQSLLK